MFINYKSYLCLADAQIQSLWASEQPSTSSETSTDNNDIPLTQQVNKPQPMAKQQTNNPFCYTMSKLKNLVASSVPKWPLTTTTTVTEPSSKTPSVTSSYHTDALSPSSSASSPVIVWSSDSGVSTTCNSVVNSGDSDMSVDVRYTLPNNNDDIAEANNGSLNTDVEMTEDQQQQPPIKALSFQIPGQGISNSVPSFLSQNQVGQGPGQVQSWSQFSHTTMSPSPSFQQASSIHTEAHVDVKNLLLPNNNSPTTPQQNQQQQRETQQKTVNFLSTTPAQNNCARHQDNCFSQPQCSCSHDLPPPQAPPSPPSNTQAGSVSTTPSSSAAKVF